MEKRATSKVWKRIGKSLLFLLFIGIVLWVFGILYAKPLLESKIKNTFNRSTVGRYEITFDDLNFSYSDAGISISNLHIQAKADSIQALDSTSLVEITCSKVSVIRVNLWKTLFSKNFAADELELENPILKLWSTNKSKPASKASDGNKFSQIQIGKIRIKNAEATVINKTTGSLFFDAKNLNLFVDGFDITSDLIPVYEYFTLESTDNSIGLFPDQQFKVSKLFMTGGPAYTGLNASGFNIREIDSSLRKTLKIPEEINFSLNGISLESESLADLVEQIIKGKTEYISISKLLLIHPVVSIQTRRTEDEKTAAASDKFNLVSKKLALPSVKKIGVLDGTFLWKEIGTEKPVLEISHIHFMANGLRPRYGQKVPFTYATAEATMGKTKFTYPKSQYSFYAKNIQYRSVTDSLKINGFEFLPHQNIDSFYMDKKWREDRFEFYCDTIHVENLRIADFVIKDEFNPAFIVFKSPILNAYTDKRLNHDPTFTKPFPLQKLREFDGKYNIGKIAFENGKATYTEKVAESPGLGKLHLDQANLQILNIKSQATANDTAHILYNCTLGGGSYAEIKIDIPLFGEDEIQFGKGMIKNLPFKQLNSITENTVYMGFASGMLDSCWFSFKGLNGISEGKSVFYYKDLRVKIYKLVDVPAYKSKILMSKGLSSIVANLLLNKNNPTEEGFSIPGKIEFKRDKLKGPLNFWIKSIMTGMMNTVIDDISELKDLQGEIKSLKSNSKSGLLSKIKSNPVKKTIRKQARDARKAVKNAGETK